MSIKSTALSTILNRMNRWQTIYDVEELYKVEDIDEAIRTARRKTSFYWNIKKATLKVFTEVFAYPTATDHSDIVYLDNQNSGDFASKARFKYTSLQEFYEDPTNRNYIAEIWDGGQKYLGVNYKGIEAQTLKVDDADATTNYSYTGDVTSLALDTVVYKEGVNSIKVNITNVTGIATVANTLAITIPDTNYKSKYYFRWFYFDNIPTSVELKFGNDASNYLYSGVLTSQFSGQGFKTNDWNLLAFDLNEATEVGTIDPNAFNYEEVIFNGASTGVYRIDESSLKAWELLDYYYNSIYSVTTDGNNLNKEYFKNDAAEYDITHKLVGDSEWIDVIMFEAITSAVADRENSKIFAVIDRKRQEAWEALYEKYPSQVPVIVTNRWRFLRDAN